MHPNAIIGSAIGWALGNVSIVMVDTEIRVGKMISRMLWIAANRIHRAQLPPAILGVDKDVELAPNGANHDL